MDIMLSIENITKRFPGVLALDHISFAVNRGEVHALMGENGAGKSTLIKIISGAHKADEGRLVLNGKSFTQLTPAISKAQGIGVIYQELNLVPSLSVTENIFLGKKVGGKIFPDKASMKKRAKELLDELGTELPLDAMVGSLSVAQQQLVEIAKALGDEVQLLVMDEPSSSLAIGEAQHLFKIIRRLRQKGITIIYISHRMEEVFDLADSITVLRDGCHIKTCKISEVSRKDVIKLMVGRELDETFPVRHTEIGAPVLELDHLTGNGDTDINFQLHKGEILGLAGLVGAGRTEIAKVIYGAVAKESGKLLVHGQEVNFRSPRDAVKAGIGLIPENRKTEGTFLDFPIDWNVAIMALEKYSVMGFVQQEKLNGHVGELIERFRVKTPSYTQLVRNLSGGNQQKVVIAKVLAAGTNIIIFDEPTRGIDIGVKQEIYQLMNELSESGISIIMISSEMEELMGMADRIIVLHEGKMAGELSKEEFQQQKILELASGMQEAN